MAFITDILNTIKNARKGKDMRQAIHDGIEQCYKDATGHPESVAATVKKIGEVSANLLKETADRKAEVNTERKRIDNLIKELPTTAGEYQQSKLVSHGYNNTAVKCTTTSGNYTNVPTFTTDQGGPLSSLHTKKSNYQIAVNKSGLYLFELRIHVNSLVANKRVELVPFINNTRNAALASSYNTVGNFTLTTVAALPIWLSANDTVDFRIAPIDAAEVSLQLADVLVYAIDWEDKFKIPDYTGYTAETRDIRTGADGTVYGTAGEAVRKQIGNLTEDLGDIGIDCISIAVVSNGYFTQGGGNATDDTCRKTDYIKFDKNEFIILKYIFNGYIWCCYELYDANKTSIGERVVFTSEANRVVRIYPTKDTQYIRFAWSITNIVSITASLYEKTGYSDAKIETVKKNLLEEIDNLENDDFAVSQGYIPIKLITDKFLTSSGIAAYANWSATENIKVEGLDCIYTEWSKTSSYNKFLDSSFGFIKMVTIKDGLQKTNVPEGSCYVAFSNETTVMEGLRVWSPTKTNLYENALEISKLKQDIPSYYEKHLTDKITEVRAKETFSGVSGDEFIFITDYHMERNANNSPSLIDKIIHQTGAKKIVFGGDAYDASSAPDLALNKIADFYSMFYENADKILSCVGNHEYNNPASNKPEQQIPNGQVYASIVNRNDLIHHSRYTCNYTILNRSNETMYVFIGCEYSSNITNESIKYVLETIKNNYGYNIIVFSHVGLDNGGDDGNVANIVGGFKRMTDGIDKFNQKSNYIFDGITYDYSGCTGEVICVFSGHNHVDGCIRTDGGLNVISTTCDAYGAPEGGVVRTKGTITEQAFDVVNIDYENKKIYMTRVGAGEDRVFSY